MTGLRVGAGLAVRRGEIAAHAEHEGHDRDHHAADVARLGGDGVAERSSLAAGGALDVVLKLRGVLRRAADAGVGQQCLVVDQGARIGLVDDAVGLAVVDGVLGSGNELAGVDAGLGQCVVERDQEAALEIERQRRVLDAKDIGRGAGGKLGEDLVGITAGRDRDLADSDVRVFLHEGLRDLAQYAASVRQRPFEGGEGDLARDALRDGRHRQPGRSGHERRGLDQRAPRKGLAAGWHGLVAVPAFHLACPHLYRCLVA